MLTGLAADLRAAWRAICRSARSSVFVVALLAAGLGGGSALVMLLESVVLRPLSVPHADRLALIEVLGRDGGHRLMPLKTLAGLERRQSGFDALAGHTPAMSFHAKIDGRLVGASLITVSGDFFELLGVTPYMGRVLTRADNESDPGDGTLPVVVSYDFWQRELGASTEVVGSELELDGRVVTIVGVTERGYRGLGVEGTTDVSITLNTFGRLVGVNDPRVGVRANYVVGRVRQGATLEDAAANLQGVWPAARERGAPPVSAREMEDFLAQQLDVTSFRSGFSVYRTRYRDALNILLALTAALVFLVSANLAGILIARNAARSGEWRVRRALGARATHLLRLSLCESGLYVAMGLVLAAPIAWWGSGALIRELWLGSSAPDFVAVPGRWTFAIVGAAVVATTIVMGLAPACLASDVGRVSPGTTSTVVPRPRTIIRLMVAGQLAMSLAVACAAGLLARNLTQWWDVDPGFDPDGVTLVYLAGQAGQNDYSALARSLPDLVDRLRAVPGAEAVALSQALTRYSMAVSRPSDVFEVGGPETAVGRALRDRISPGLFAVLKAGRLAGRDFTWADDETQPPVAIVTRRLAETIAPEGALGVRIRVGTDARELEIVGVVDQLGTLDPRMRATDFVFTPILQDVFASNVPVVTIRSSAGVSAAALRDIIEPRGFHYVINATTMHGRTSTLLAAERVTAALAVTFGMLALLVASAGLAGLLTYLVEGRRREFGVRLALGASRGQLIGTVVRESVLLVAAGLILGLPAAYGAGRLVEAMLVNVQSTDVVAFTAGGATLMLTALLAALAPALRAARTDPVVALRAE